MTNFNPLFITPQWLKEYHTKYPHGLSVMENLIEWVNQVNDLIDWANVTPDKALEIMNSWLTDGTIDAALNQAFLHQSINVLHHGLVNDGVTDNSAALENLILSTKNQPLYFPQGTYFFSRSINPYKNQYYDYLGNETEDGTFSLGRGVIETINFIGHDKETTFFKTNGNPILSPQAIAPLKPLNILARNIRFVGEAATGTPFEILNGKVNVIYMRLDNCDFNNWEYGFKYDFRSPVGTNYNTMAYFEKCNFGGNNYGAMVTGDNSTLMECYIRNNNLGGLIVGGSQINIRGGKVEYNGRDNLVDPFQIQILTNSSQVTFDGTYIEPKTSNVLADNNLDTLIHIARNAVNYNYISAVKFKNCRFNGLRVGRLLKSNEAINARGIVFEDCQIFSFKLLTPENELMSFPVGSVLWNTGVRGGIMYDIQNAAGGSLSEDEVLSSSFPGINSFMTVNKAGVYSAELRKNGDIEKISGSVSGTASRYYGIKTYSIVNEDTGKYLVTLYKPNKGLASGNTAYFPVTVTPRHVTGSLRLATVENIDAQSFRVHIQSETGTYFNNGFSFEATIITD